MQVPRRPLRDRIEHLLAVDQDSKPRLYLQIFDAAEIFSLNYVLELMFAAAIATLGLVLNSPAVVIGAMLISPLMGPILAGGLALATADLYLGLKSFLNILLSCLSSIAFAATLVWLLPFHSPTHEILARTNPNLLDLGVALFSGLAGSVVVFRGGGGGGVTALPGVAIAVALMPPLCTVGFGVGSGFLWDIMSGAGLLFLTNLAAIMASAFLVFYLVRMDAPELRTKIDYSILERAAGDRLYRALMNTRLARGFGDIGKLRWRILMLGLTLVALFIPLRKSLSQLRDESIARSAAQEAIAMLTSPAMLLNQQLDLSRDRVALRLIVTETVTDEKLQEAEKLLARRTGKDVSILVRKVASQEELASLTERMRVPTPPPADMAVLQAEVLGRLERPLRQVWPNESAKLLGWEIGFTPEDVVVRIRYEADQPLNEAGEAMLTRILQSQLRIDKLRVLLERQSPQSSATPAKK
jgi:uncharacterized hydrophobic protein (TIGR00271 family)